MHPRTADARERFLARVAESAMASAGERFGIDLEAYVRQYYRNTALDDLKARAVEDLAGATLSHLELGRRRPPGSPCIRVYNPDADRDGWNSPHTIVQVVTDDMPFLVDSTSISLNRHGNYIHLTVHPVLQVVRDDAGQLLDVPPPDHAGPDARLESFMHLEIDRVTAPDVLQQLAADLERALGDVRAACTDWGTMRARAREICAELEQSPPPLDAEVVKESRELLEWMADDHFTFLGYREYDLLVGEDADELRPIPDTALGILRRPPPSAARESTRLAGREIRRQARSRDLLELEPDPRSGDYIVKSVAEED